jgi:hypothetical protein
MSRGTGKLPAKINESVPKGNAEKHAASGAKLLNRREPEREVAERRGAL